MLPSLVNLPNLIIIGEKEGSLIATNASPVITANVLFLPQKSNGALTLSRPWKSPFFHF